MYRPREWQKLASQIANVMSGNGTSVVNRFHRPVELNTDTPVSTMAAIYAIMCSDGPDFKGMSNDEVVEESLQAQVIMQKSVTKHFAQVGLNLETCHHWKESTVERFTGPFNHTLKNEILVIGNTADVSFSGFSGLLLINIFSACNPACVCPRCE